MSHTGAAEVSAGQLPPRGAGATPAAVSAATLSPGGCCRRRCPPPAAGAAATQHPPAPRRGRLPSLGFHAHPYQHWNYRACTSGSGTPWGCNFVEQYCPSPPPVARTAYCLQAHCPTEQVLLTINKQLFQGQSLPAAARPTPVEQLRRRAPPSPAGCSTSVHRVGEGGRRLPALQNRHQLTCRGSCNATWPLWRSCRVRSNLSAPAPPSAPVAAGLRG